MNEREQKSFILFLAKEWKDSFRDILAYRMLIAMLKKAGIQGLDESLELFRQAPALLTRLDAQFAELEKMLPSAAEASIDQAILELLERYKPTGEPN